ncbi:hypothetical protein HGM15179_013664 [Zosterops borbonicus]|uniref:Uncharacterized protein n=1 Tax=Zosterops borbonicus TaxID=364589 RepID=A0A8K1G8C2_9PASS|nr:hypothetical protein HGM15179_013664 [Zosterops borbonicus]
MVISGDSPKDEELSDVEEDIEVGPENSTSDFELSELGEAIKLFPGVNSGDKELSPREEDNQLSPGDGKDYKELSAAEKMQEKELSQGDNNEGKKPSPEDIQHDTEMRFGEDCDVEEMSPWEEDNNKQLSHWEEHEDEELSHWEEDEDEKLTRRALLGGMDRDSSSSPELPDLQQVSRHWKVLESLEAHFPNKRTKLQTSTTVPTETARTRWKPNGRSCWTPCHLLVSKLVTICFPKVSQRCPKGKLPSGINPWAWWMTRSPWRDPAVPDTWLQRCPAQQLSCPVECHRCQASSC